MSKQKSTLTEREGAAYRAHIAKHEDLSHSLSKLLEYRAHMARNTYMGWHRKDPPMDPSPREVLATMDRAIEALADRVDADFAEMVRLYGPNRKPHS